MEAFLPGLMRVAYSCEDNFLWNRQKKTQIILLVLLSSVLQATSTWKTKPSAVVFFEIHVF